MTVHEVKTVSEYNDAISKNKLVAVDFSAKWCGPCHAIAPEFEKLAEAEKDVYFIKVDIDDSPDISRDIRAVPTFRFYKSGQKEYDFAGATVQKLKDTVKAFQ